MENANVIIPKNSQKLLWARTNALQTPHYAPDSKPYRLYSKWHLVHSVRAGVKPKYEKGKLIKEAYEFILTLDGFDLESAEVKEYEQIKRNADFCSNCYSVFRYQNESVDLGV